MKTVLYVSNIPTPYKIDFLNELGKKVEVTALFEAKGASDQGIKFDWQMEMITNFKAVFLDEDNIKEKHINLNAFKRVNYKKFDKIIISNYSYMTEMAILIYLKVRKIKYLLAVDGGKINKELFIKKLFKRYLISGQGGAELYFSPCKESDKFLIYYGVKPERIRRYPFTSFTQKDIDEARNLNQAEKEKLREQLKISEKRMVLYVGQFIYRKGIDILLEACKKIDPVIGIYLIGGIPAQEYLEATKNMNNVHFIDFKTKEKLKLYYEAADIFVLPTREDIWGLVVNEAMAYGLPVITTDQCNAGVELISDGFNGYIIPADDSSMLAERITHIFETEGLLAELSINSKNSIQRYTIENMASVYLESMW